MRKVGSQTGPYSPMHKQVGIPSRSISGKAGYIGRLAQQLKMEQILKRSLNSFLFLNEELEWKTCKDIGTYSFAQQLLNLKGVVLLPIITRAIGVEAYGYYSLATIASGFLMWFLMLGIPAGLIRFLAGESDSRVIGEDFSLGLLVAATTSACCIVAALGFSSLASELFFQTSGMNRLAILVVIFTAMEALRSVSFTYLRLHNEIRTYTFLEVFRNLGTLLCVAVALQRGHNVEAIFIVQAAFSFMTMLIVPAFCFKGRFCMPSVKRAKTYLSFCIPLMIPGIMVWVMTRCDRYIINFYAGAKAVGIYSANFNIPILIQSALNSIAFVYDPILNGLWNNNKMEELRLKIRSYANLFLFFALPMLVGMTVLSRPVMRLLSTEEIAGSSLKIVPFVGLAYVVYLFYGFGMNITLYQKRSVLAGSFTIIGAIVGIGGNVLLVPHLGLMGASLSMLVSYIIMSVVAVGTARKHLAIRFDWEKVCVMSCASVLMGICVVAMREFTNGLFVLISGGILAYFVSFVLLAKVVRVIPTGILNSKRRTGTQEWT